MSGVDPGLLSLLVCPSCAGELSERARWLACLACRCVYPVQEGVPILLPSRARKLAADRKRGNK